MQSNNKKHRYAALWIRLTARALSLVIIVLELLLIFGEGVYPSSEIEWIGFFFFPIGISAGMIIAWWREGIGGAITVGSFVLFYFIYFAFSHTHPKGLAWFVFALPGFLFLIYWFLTRRLHD